MTDRRPVLIGDRVTVRAGTQDDVAALYAILSEPAVMRWWREPDPPTVIAGDLRGSPDEVLLVIEVAGEVAGGIQYYEETDEDYRHASIDVFLGERWQGQELGVEAIRLLARHLLEEHGHHRLTIDPAADNVRAIAAYRKVGFRPVGIMRQYERGVDGTWHDGLLMDLVKDEFECR